LTITLGVVIFVLGYNYAQFTKETKIYQSVAERPVSYRPYLARKAPSIFSGLETKDSVRYFNKTVQRDAEGSGRCLFNLQPPTKRLSSRGPRSCNSTGAWPFMYGLQHGSWKVLYHRPVNFRYDLPDETFITEQAKLAKVPSDIALAIAWMETRTNTNPNVRGRAGEVGRFQIGAASWLCRDLAITQYEPNVSCGLRVLRYLYDKHGSWAEAIRRYNGSGPKSRAYASTALAYIGWLSLRRDREIRGEQ
jgi:soluble lytic murein transglycosylase-like protein